MGLKNKKIMEKYEIIEKFPQGGMSEVFLVKHKFLDTKKIIKIINKKAVPDVMLMTEPTILKNASHASIPKIHDIEQDDDHIYVHKEYVEGITLDSYVKKNGPISKKLAKSLMTDLYNVIDYLHTFSAVPIIHRDIKPSNIIITPQKRAVLIDFGISRTYKKLKTRDTHMFGSVLYSAPELFGDSQSDTRSDIYSLGLIYYYMLTAKELDTPPYEVIPPRLIDSKISKTADKIIMKSTSRNPQKRYKSVTNILAALKKDEKKRSGLITLLCAVFAVFALISGIILLGNNMRKDDYLNEVYNFNNPHLEQMIKKELEIEYRDVYYFDLLEITDLKIIGEHIWINDRANWEYFSAYIEEDHYYIDHTNYFDINTDMADIRDIAAMENLTELYINCCTISDISPLSELNKLTTLNLQSNQISDISSVTSLVNLETLVIENNKVSDLSPIMQLNSLNKLNVVNNPIDHEDITAVESLQLSLFLY